eukprot:10560641-Karenia_brevis.AAC.1
MPSELDYEYDNEAPNRSSAHVATCSIPMAPDEIAVITGRKSPMRTPFRVATPENIIRSRQQRDTLRDAFEELVNTCRTAQFIAKKY